MLSLGTPAPELGLPDAISGRTVQLSEFSGSDALLIMFICNHCPYVVHIQQGLTQFGRDYTDTNLAIVGINANSDQTHPQDGPENMRALAEELDWQFPFLFDGTQTVAKTYRAACTPEFYLFDGGHKLVYRGQFDGSRPGNQVPVTGTDLRDAVDAVLEGRSVPAEQYPGIGCNIKWHPGNEPDY
jgi:peroxiredoxin